MVRKTPTAAQGEEQRTKEGGEDTRREEEEEEEDEQEEEQEEQEDSRWLPLFLYYPWKLYTILRGALWHRGWVVW